MGRLLYIPTANFVQKTLNAQLLAATTAAATLNNITNLPSKPGVMIVDRTDANGTETPNKVEVIEYTSTSGLTATDLTRGLAGTTAQDHAVGAIVEFGPDIQWAQALLDAMGTLVDPLTGQPDIKNPKFTLGSDATGDMFYRGSGGTLTRIPLGSASQVLTANASIPYWATPSASSGGTAFWSALPTTPTWVSTNQMSIDDVGNAGKYNILFAKKTIFKWDDGSYRNAMSAGASYASNKVYIGLLGSTLSTLASLPSLKYSISKAEMLEFIIPGTLPSAASTNISKQYVWPEDTYVFGSDAVAAVNGSGATMTVFDFNDDSTSLYGTGATLHNWFPTLATTSLNVPTLNPETAVAAGSRGTLDMDSVNQTAQTDVYFYVYQMPAALRYRS